MQKSLSAAQLLGPDGPFASGISSYEHRSGQLSMAAAVERALREQRVLLCEAGTGIGKTLAYLVPALLSGKRVVVSTATRALQEQIAHHDLPLVARSLGLNPRVVVMKGLANYLCRRRFGEFRRSVEALRPKHARSLSVLEDWVQRTETGEIAELAGLGEGDPIWPHVTSSSDTRIGASCAHYDECFVTRLRREAEAAQLIVVNHHLFFADLALRGPHPASVLPDYEAVVFDEAHQIEDVAGLFFGCRVSRLRISRFVHDCERIVAGLPGVTTTLVEQLMRRSEQMWEILLEQATGLGPRVTLESDIWGGRLQEAYFAMDNALEAAGALFQGVTRQQAGVVPTEALELIVRRASGIREQLASIVEGGAGTVTWLECAPPALSATPVDLAPVLQDRVFASIPCVILTSATLTTGASRAGPNAGDAHSPFGYARRRFGLIDAFEAEELSVESPFDFEKNALLYTPIDLPPARAPSFLESAAERISDLVAITGGGAFVLTTSLASMRRLHALLRPRLAGQRVFLQGDAPKQALVAAFRAAEDAVLVATQSFWEGVDVPGKALRLVILEKLPFAVPTDPIMRARALAIERQGGNAFMELFVPDAAIALKQGFGRLIRTRRDAGVVALLDERVHSRGYARRLLGALPSVRRTDDIEVVREFWTEVQERF